MYQSLSNPVFWQGFATAYVLCMVAGVVFLILIGRANDTIPLRNHRGGDRRPWPGTADAANDDAKPRTARSEMRGGPQ